MASRPPENELVAGLWLADGERFNAMKFGIPVTAMVGMVPIVISEEETAGVSTHIHCWARAVIGLLGAGLSPLSIMLRTER